MARQIVLCGLLLIMSKSAQGLAPTCNPIKKLSNSIVIGYQQRIQADANFKTKSITELLLAISTQFTAEVSRRGASRIVPELDFVVPGILTAMAGKYYSMWRVAPTQETKTFKDETTSATWLNMQVPTNAFQETLLDGVTCPTPLQRFASLLVPMPSLFQAGFLAALVGYGFTSILIGIRSLVLPNFVPPTRQVNVLQASIYTGFFVALISNIRYQVLQGIIEPKLVDPIKNVNQQLYAVVLFLVRTANGLLGANLSILGMKRLGMFQLK